jgi:hypothetical protein
VKRSAAGRCLGAKAGQEQNGTGPLVMHLGKLDRARRLSLLPGVLDGLGLPPSAVSPGGSKGLAVMHPGRLDGAGLIGSGLNLSPLRELRATTVSWN